MLQKNKDLLRLLEESTLTILNRINDPIIVIDQDGFVVFVNSAYEYQVGVSREQVLNKNLNKKYPNDMLLYVLKTGLPIEEEEHYNETLGFDIVASFLPLKDTDGKIKGVIGVGNTGSMYKLNKHLRSIVLKKQKKLGVNLVGKNYRIVLII
jgi:PAS domain S-box-containing protein